MRKIKRPKIGEYVLVTRWSDKDPNDPWYVGFISEIIISDYGIRYKVYNSSREWNCCFRITQDEGEQWLKDYMGDGC